jgi:hypothetical protein
MAYRGRKQEDSKYVKLTGLWQNKKKDNLCTGKMRTEDIEKVMDKLQEALDANAEAVVFLWENDKRGQKDPDFTVQVAVSEGEVGSSRGRSYGRSSSRGRDREEPREEREESRDRDRDREPREEPEEEVEEEEKPVSRNRKSAPEPNRKSAPEPARKKTKNDDNW